MSPHRPFGWRLACALALFVVAGTASAESSTLRVARQYGIGYLQIMLMERERLIEKHARALGISDVTVTWRTIGDGALANDAMIAGDLDVVAGGLGSFLTLWDRTRGTLRVKGIAALDSMPMLLNTRDPGVKSVGDFRSGDRIALAGVKVSSQAVTLQRAAARLYGEAHWAKLDPLTVNMPHPTAMQVFLQERSDVTAHFGSIPFQYQELRQPGVRTILDSYDVWGGPQTFILAWTTSTFREQNPKLYAAVLAALAEATATINADKRAAAAAYLAMSGDRNLAVDDLARMLADPNVLFTMTPQRVVAFAAFRADIGTIATRPASWKELFFDDIHALPGS